MSREWTLVCMGRCVDPLSGLQSPAVNTLHRPVSVARGYNDPRAGADGMMNAEEAIKSNALMRCCKDLGVASELWCALIYFMREAHCLTAYRNRRYVNEIKRKLKSKQANNAYRAVPANNPYGR